VLSPSMEGGEKKMTISSQSLTEGLNGQSVLTLREKGERRKKRRERSSPIEKDGKKGEKKGRESLRSIRVLPRGSRRECRALI